MSKKIKLRYFPDTDAVLDFIMDELIAYMQDYLTQGREEGYDREVLRVKTAQLKDVQRVERLVRGAGRLAWGMREALKEVS